MTRCVAPKLFGEVAVARAMTYRDANEAARERRESLRRELAEVDQQIAHGAHRDEQRRTLQRALHDAEREIDRERAKVALPLLAQVRVARPCPARWEDMKGDDHARHCRACDKTVFDLSSLTRDDAEALLQRHGAAMCVRFYRRADGTVMTADCSVGVASARRKSMAIAAGLTAAAGLGVLGVGAAAATAWVMIAGDEDTAVMGEIAEPVQGGISFVPPPPEPVQPDLGELEVVTAPPAPEAEQ